MRRMFLILAASIALAACAWAVASVPAHADASAYCSGDQLLTGANWSVCWEVRANEGLVITDAFWVGGGADERVLSGASVAQTFVPYETGQPRYHDVAYGLGPAMQPIPAAACPGTLIYAGRVCVENESRGLSEFFCTEGNCHSKMGQSLAVWSASQMGAYMYITRWEFHDDGTIEPAFGFSGILQFGPTDHTHNVYWRLDMDVGDPAQDRVEEFYRIVPAWSDGTRGVSAWTPLNVETFRANDLNTFRKWRVVSVDQTNAKGHPRSYELVPHVGDGNFRSIPAEGFTRGELFVTKARDSERFVSTETSDLLSTYLNGESVDGADVVLWYVIHEHHNVRDEDSPYMPTEWIDFELRPRSFFDQNPME